MSFAFKFSVAFSVGGSIAQNVVFWAYYTVVLFIKNVRIWSEKACLSHWSFVWKNGDSAVIKNFFAYPRCFVACVYYYCFDFRMFFCHTVIKSIKCHAVMYIARIYRYINNIAMLITSGLSCISKTFFYALPCGKLRFPGRLWIHLQFSFRVV